MEFIILYYGNMEGWGFMYNAFIKHKMAEGLSEATITSYCFALKDFYQWQLRNGIKTVTPTDIEDYFIFIRGKSYSPATIRDKYAVLHACFNWLQQQGYIAENPVKMKKPPLPKERARCFTQEEIEIIMRYFVVRDTFTKIRDYTIICLLFSTGMRRNELLNITACDGDFITVIGKGGKQRNLPVSVSLRRVLREYIPQREKVAVCPFLVVTRTGEKMTINGLRAVFTRLSQNTGISGKRFSAHTWRHTFSTRFLKQGGSLASLQRILGHSDIQTTAIYLHYDDSAIKKENDMFNPLNNFRNNFFI